MSLRGQISTPVAAELRLQKVPFLISSAYRQETVDGHQAFDGVENIGKPVAPQRLVAAIARLLQPGGPRL